MATKKKKTTRKKARVNAEQVQAKRQLHALILLAVAILSFCLALFEGENVWTWLHEILLGLFSYSAYVLKLYAKYRRISATNTTETDTSVMIAP